MKNPSIEDVDSDMSEFQSMRSEFISEGSSSSDYLSASSDVTDSDPYNSSDDEAENSEVVERLVDTEKSIYDEALNTEKLIHAFTEFYGDAPSDYNFAKNVRALFDNYTHEKALRYIAKSLVWMHRSPPTEVLPTAPPTKKAVRQFVFVYSTYALYRVVSEKRDKYILLACHQNVHGFHRGDLRFVEVNNRTRTNASRYSCIGHLAHGDIVAVTELARTNAMPHGMKFVDVHQLNQETPCVWMVKNMTLLKRQKFRDVSFAFLGNGTAIVIKWGQVLMVKGHENKWEWMNENKIFIGKGFIPMKTPDFATGVKPEKMTELLEITNQITKYPFSTGTIFTYEYSEYFTQQFAIGTNAYKTNNQEPEAIVELCALMGSTAITAVVGGQFDCRSLQMINPTRDNELMIRFSIDNSLEPKPEGLWKANTRISIGSSNIDANAVIETIITDGSELRIVARLSREHYGFQFIDNIHMVSQREMPEGKSLQEGFLEDLPLNSNGRMIIETLYGGIPMIFEPLLYTQSYVFPGSTPIPLNEFQNEYVERLLQKTPLTVANSPFGCGKSMTIATAAYYAVHISRELKDGTQQLLVTQSNYASVNLVDITKKYIDQCRVVRFVTEKNWLELPDASRTDLDLPVRMQQFFMNFVTGRHYFPNKSRLIQMAIYLKAWNLIDVEFMEPRCQQYFKSNKFMEQYDFYKLSYMFFEIYQPEIVIVTSDSLRCVLPVLNRISTVQFDEASQVPECALIQVLSTFPQCCFGLVGDIQQLPPYCDAFVTGHLRTYGVGNTMERAVNNRLFPQVVLRYVYRCHPITTEILGSLFYGGRLISAVTEDDRNEFMKKRTDFWPNEKFPIMVVNNPATSLEMGTSKSNYIESEIVEHIINTITSPSYHYSVKPSDIGIISFYKAQTALLTERFRERNIKCGTVDAFQGTEKEIIILCCTTEYVNGFLAMKNRINVAMSRAKQTTIIVGNISVLQVTKYWSTFVQKAYDHKCILSSF